MAAPTRAVRAPIAPATGVFLKAAPVADERVVEAVPLAGIEVEGREVPDAEVPDAEVPDAEVPGAEVLGSETPELRPLETMGRETVSIQGQGRAGNKVKGKHRT